MTDTAVVRKHKHVVSWKSALERVGMKKETLDRKKLMAAIDADLTAYLASKSSKSAAPAIDPAALKGGTAKLHSTFAQYAKKGELEMGALAMVFGIETGNADLAGNKTFIRSLVNHPENKGTFDIGWGGNPIVYRLKDAKGKATGMKAPVKVRKSSAA